MPYSDNLNDEKPVRRKQLLPIGWRQFRFVDGKETTSKAGNSMFTLSIEDQETKYVEDIYIVRTPGKRWLLKSILEAVDIKRGEDGSFTYELADILNKPLMGEVVHEPNEYINRNGDTINTTQHKIVGFKKFTPSEIQWEN